MAITLPITLPASLDKDADYQEIRIPIRLTADLSVLQEVLKIRSIKEPCGNVFKIAAKRTAWKFDGLILDEIVVEKKSQDILLTESVRGRILADISLVSPNQAKVTWYGDQVPSVIILKKLEIDDDYVVDGKYAWGVGSAIVKIDSNDYNIKLEGINSSGDSSVYTIAATNDVEIIPTLDMVMNEKVFDISVNYTNEYSFTVNY